MNVQEFYASYGKNNPEPVPGGNDPLTHRLTFNKYQSAPAPMTKPDNDPINNPRHYTAHPSGVECIQITEHMGFCLGNAIKYIWRADLKHDAIEDLKKARWYIDREIAKREKQ